MLINILKLLKIVLRFENFIFYLISLQCISICILVWFCISKITINISREFCLIVPMRIVVCLKITFRFHFTRWNPDDGVSIWFNILVTMINIVTMRGIIIKDQSLIIIFGGLSRGQIWILRKVEFVMFQFSH